MDLQSVRGAARRKPSLTMCQNTAVLEGFVLNVAQIGPSHRFKNKV